MSDTQIQDPQTAQPQGGAGLFHGNAQHTQPEANERVTWVPSNAKETESARGGPELSLSQSSTETELPKEVVEAGVRPAATTIDLPPNLKSLGMQSTVSKSTTHIFTEKTTLPLNDEQIALGLKQDIFSSWRWFSEWCVRKLKQAHQTVRHAHNKFIRVNA